MEEKKINKVALYFKIWLLHNIVYYCVFGFMLTKGYESFFKVQTDKWLLEFVQALPVFCLGGVMFVLDGGMLYASMIMMAILWFIFRIEIFKAYIWSLIASILVWFVIFCVYVDYGSDFLKGLDQLFRIIIPSAVVVIIVNWLVFRNTYRRLKDENTIKKEEDTEDK